MRRIAAQSQQHALALIAEIDRVVGTQRGSSGIEISRAVRTAVESVTSTLLDTELGAEPISPEWPPQLGDAPQTSMLGH
jgi:GTP cyclohydrolase FolE2